MKRLLTVYIEDSCLNMLEEIRKKSCALQGNESRNKVLEYCIRFAFENMPKKSLELRK
jgi:hypothetical protein